MNASLLLEHYERIAEAPDAIARLRRFVLDLAVRGKLVDQDTNDEPASVLLKRSAVEKAQAGLKGKLSPISLEEAPYELPRNWVWSRIGSICTKTGSGSTPRGGKDVYRKSGIPFLRSQNIYNEGLRLDDVAFIDPETHARMGSTSVYAADLLLNITGGSMGRCCRVPDDFSEANVSQHVAIIRPAIREMTDFLHSLILSPYFQAFVFDEQTGAGRGGLPKNRMDNIIVALPPLAEQHRIVAKVAELMALCDQLERVRATRETARHELTVASLARLNGPNPEFFADHVRFALEHLELLTKRKDQIKRLRQTILNVALRGKLVAQDPNDEPATLLINQLAADRGDSEHRHSKTFANVPFPPPSGWLWISMNSILGPSRDISYGVIKLGPEPKSGGIPTLRCSDVRPGYIDLSGVRKIDPSIEGEYARTRLQGGEILINIRGTLGGVAHVPADLSGYNVAREVAVIPISQRLSGQFMVYLLLSSFFWDMIEGNLRGIAYKGLNLGILREFPIPIPPIAEQHRIVAKVDEIMSLCAQLELNLADGEQTRSRLLEAVLHEALQAA